jgi:putative copper resistance protein D
MILLVLFSLPDSRARLVQLARASSDLEFSGAEIVAIPIGGDRHIISRLGADPPMLFPIATEGAAEIAPTYALLSWTSASDGNLLKLEPPRHVEFLIDRQGYIRARWVPGGHGPGWDDLGLLRDQIQILDRQAPAAPPPDEHVH